MSVDVHPVIQTLILRLPGESIILRDYPFGVTDTAVWFKNTCNAVRRITMSVSSDGLAWTERHVLDLVPGGTYRHYLSASDFGNQKYVRFLMGDYGDGCGEGVHITLETLDNQSHSECLLGV